MLSLITAVYEIGNADDILKLPWRRDMMERFKFLTLKKRLSINPNDESDDFHAEVGMDAEIYESEGI